MQNDKLLAGMVSDMPTKSIVLSGVGVYKRGQILQHVSTDANSVDTVKAFDGALESVPFGILADEEVDTTTGSRPATAYMSGEFNMDAVVIDGTLKPMDYQGVLADAGIFLKRVRG